MSFFRSLYGGGKKNATVDQLNTLLVPLRDTICDYKDATNVSWMVILPCVQNVAFSMLVNNVGIDRTSEIFASEPITLYLPKNVPLSSLRTNELPAASPEEQQRITALVKSIANKLLAAGYPVEHVGQAFATFVVMTAAKVCDPIFAGVLLIKCMGQGVEPDGVQQEARDATSESAEQIEDSGWVVQDGTLIRQYYTSNHSNSRPVMFQVRCKLDRGTLGYIHNHVHFIISPAVVSAECFLVAYLGTPDQKTSTDFNPVRVTPIDDNGNLIWIEQQEAANKFVSVLAAGEPLLFLLLDQQNSPPAKLILQNDRTFSELYIALHKSLV